uniref:SOWAHA-C winged helix-turn-helix domain-containing protein n=1 Tax=Astatotilapia calliptera TaxID=8154 RepID=A0A3P8PKP9_ASTCA
MATTATTMMLPIRWGGRVKKSDLVDKFRESVDTADPEERERNRELFKTFVNNVAFVKEIDGERYVVLRKTYQHLLEGPKIHVEKPENEKIPLTGEQQRPPAQAGSSEDQGGVQSAVTEPDQEEASESSDHPTELLSPIQMALQRSKFAKHPKTDAFRDKRRMPSAESSTGSPQLRRHKDTRIPSMFPLEHSEHQWLVNCAAGHWSQAYGLLLRDNQLAEKKDFMSGFTALHWAAKTGNSDMFVKIIEKARQGGVHVDINAKTHGGYTPLHIAALHDKQYIIGILVKEYEANISIRDNYGKKAYHYLHKDVSESVREMLCKPKPQPAEDRALHEKEELDLFPDLSKGLHSISRLFQPNVTGHKKKHKQRPGLYSLNNDPIEEGEDSGTGFRHRPMSDVFM